MSTVVIEIVCHDAGLLDMLDMSLSDEGYVVNSHITSTTGDDLFDGSRPALRIVEVRPDRSEDNRRLWDEVRSSPHAHIPVIAISDRAMVDSEHGNRIEEVADGVLPLLFDLDELLQTVHQTLCSWIPSSGEVHLDQSTGCDGRCATRGE